MLERFRTRQRNRQIVDDLYAGIVAAARREVLYTALGLPDTVMGRFEALSIHVFLFLARCRDDLALKPLAQDLVDRFMSDVEDSIREIGIGDVTVPKRMRKLAGMFYERVDAYDAPLRAGDVEGLTAALRSHALPVGATEVHSAGLAAHMLTKKQDWDAIAAEEILSGRRVLEV